MTAPKKCAKHKIKSKYEDMKGQKKKNIDIICIHSLSSA